MESKPIGRLDDAEFEHGRRIDAGRKSPNHAIGQACQFGLGRVDTVVRLKKDFDVAHPGERLRFDVFDVTRFHEPLLQPNVIAPSISLGLRPR